MFKRTNFLYRLNSTAKVGWSSSITFATVGTALSTLVVVPGMSVLFSVLLGRDLSAPDPVRIACASALASVVLGVAAGVVARAATAGWECSSRCAPPDGLMRLIGWESLQCPCFWL